MQEIFQLKKIYRDIEKYTKMCFLLNGSIEFYIDYLHNINVLLFVKSFILDYFLGGENALHKNIFFDIVH